MCGIFGWLGSPAQRAPDPLLAKELRDRLHHRGPDANGAWHDAEAGVWLGHRRLSIVDLSEAGAQPMVSASGRYVITYNGEVFNHDDLRADLAALGHGFRGHSDTEVILAAIEQWGLEAALARFIGFFAIGLWNRQERRLILVRDRVGVKPLYYAAGSAGDFAFASELRALRGLPWVDEGVDAAALACYFHFLAVSPPATVLRGVRALPPGHLLHWDAATGTADVTAWWSVADAVARGKAEPFTGSFTEAADALEELLTDAVSRRLMGDVPVGAFLSGGVDSSLVTALMVKAARIPVRTFTIAFEDKSHDESAHAAAVASHLGTDHSIETFTRDDLLAGVQTLAALHDEPFADVSSLPTHLLCLSARRHVTVALSGDGGDELFGGYPRYFWAERIRRLRRRLGPLVGLVARVLSAVPGGLWDGPVDRLTGGRFTGADGLAQRVRRFASYLGAPPQDVYRSIISAWPDPAAVLHPDLRAEAAASTVGPRPEAFAHLPWSEQMMATDMGSYMVDDILTKVDRISMAVSLEAREPLLDHRVLEFSWRLPTDFKLAPGGDQGKLLLREVLYRHVPRALIERPKMGFGVPLGPWLRGPLKAWAADILSPAAVRADGLLDADAVQKAWGDLLAEGGSTHRVWTILMLLQWRRGSGEIR